MNQRKRGVALLWLAGILLLAGICGVAYNIITAPDVVTMLKFSAFGGMSAVCAGYGLHLIETWDSEVWKKGRNFSI